MHANRTPSDLRVRMFSARHLVARFGLVLSLVVSGVTTTGCVSRHTRPVVADPQTVHTIGNVTPVALNSDVEAPKVESPSQNVPPSFSAVRVGNVLYIRRIVDESKHDDKGQPTSEEPKP